MLSGHNQGVVSSGSAIGFGSRRSLTSPAAPRNFSQKKPAPVLKTSSCATTAASSGLIF
jgi:hypothetical protein